MVDLPKIPRRLVTTEAPRSMVAPEQVAAPYKMLGEALDQIGQGLEDVSVRMAEHDAQTAKVTTGPDGMPQVERPPILFGKAGAAYERIANHRLLAEMAPRIDEQVLKARQEHDGRPQAFQEWAETFVEQLAGNQANPAVSNAVRLMALQKTSETYRGMENERLRLDRTRANEAMDAQLLTLADEMEVIARQGGANTDEFNERLADYDAILKEKVNNPALAYPKEKAERARDDVLTRAYKGAILDGMEKVYRTSGMMAARRHLRDSVKELGTTVKDSNKIEREGLQWLRTEEAAFRGERDAVTREWADAKRQVADLPAVTLDTLEERASAAGAWRVSSDIRATRAALDIQRTVRTLPREQQAEIARTGVIPPAVIDKIVGVESSGDPNAKNPKSSATGLGQFTRGTWLDTVRSHRPDLLAGRTEQQVLDLRRDPKLSREMTSRLAEDNARALSSAGVPVTAGSIYLAHFLGSGDAVKALRAPAHTPASMVINPASIAANKSIFDKNPTVGDIIAWADRKMSGQAGSAGVDLTQSRPGLIALNEVKKDLRRDLQKRIDDFASADRKLSLPSPEEIAALGAEVAAVGTPEQKQRVAELAAQAEMGETFGNLTPDKRAEAIAAMNERLQAGGERWERELRDKLTAADRTINEAYSKDPYSAFYRFREGAKALPAADFGNPASLPPLLAAKVKQQDQIRAAEQLPAFSVFSKAEAGAFREAVTQGDAQAAAAIVGSLNRLPPEVLRATLADKEVRAALDGMVRSYDPTRMTAAMSVLDRVFNDDPIGFGSAFGKETTTRMQTWRGMKDSYSAPEIAELFKRADEPSMKAARDKLRDAAKDEAKTITVGDITNAIYKLDHPLLSKVFAFNPFAGHNEPTDVRDHPVATQFKVEFDTLYGEFRASGLGPDKAQEQAATRLATIWGNSTVSNQVMRYPPERYYKPIDRSHDWMRQAVTADIAAHVGMPEFEGESQNWTFTLISDPTTQAEIANGRPPRYAVAVTLAASGRTEIIADPATGKPLRYRFDDTAALEQARQDFAPARERALQPVPGIGDIGAP